MKGNKSNLTQYIPVLCLLVCLALAVGAYFKGFQEYNSKRDEVKAEIDTLTTKFDSLNKMYQNKDAYEKDMKELDAEYEKLLGDYNADITHEEVIMDLYNNQEGHDTLVEKLALTQKLPAYTFGQLISSNPTNQNPTGINMSYTGLVMEYKITNRGKYDDVKEFIDELQNSDRKRRVPTTASFTFDDSNGQVTVNMTVKEYAISGDGLKPMDVVIPEKIRGCENIFDTGVVVINN